MKNSMEIKFKAIPENVAFARNVVASFILPLNPSLDQLSDIKTAVNEAITNVVVHAYPEKTGYVHLKITTDNSNIKITISDDGIGIKDLPRALTPFYTTKPDDERSGMGFTVMESFMDKLDVKSEKLGVTVTMEKSIDNNLSVG